MKNLTVLCKKAGEIYSKVFRVFFLILIGLYRSFFTNFMGGNCRFVPSCSEYANQAFLEHEPFTALRLVTKRLIKCRPGGPYGFDPVPRRKENIIHE